MTPQKQFTIEINKMVNTESDATYCSEAEKEKLSQRRRSQRISERLSRSIRSDENPASQRFDDIYQMLKTDTICHGWSKQDWLALKYEVDLIKKSLKGFARSKITFVEMKIRQYLKKPSSPEVIVERQSDHNDNEDHGSREPVKSPNILAGMMTEALSELPPYQTRNMLNIMNTVNKTSSIAVTQVNPLDLTKKDLVVPPEQSFQTNNPSEPINLNTSSAPRVPSQDSLIDLVDDNSNEANRDTPAMVEAPKPTSSKPQTHTSKWLKYLSTQAKPKTSTEAPKPSSPLNDKPKSFKQSLIKLYKDHPNSINSVPDKTKKSSKSRLKEPSKRRALRNTENVLPHDFGLATIQPRNVQSERFASVSPDFLPDDLFQLDLAELSGDSVASLPLSLKESFKKVFGTDSLNDVFGCEKIIYNLTEGHVERLAIALNVKHDSLKRTIERILTDDSVVAPVEDDRRSNGSSVVECSQSPPHRLFPSQRSQMSK